MRLSAMRLSTQTYLVAAAAAAVSWGAWAQGIEYAKIEILTEKIAPNLYILSGSSGADPGHEDAAGGRIGVLAGPDGIFMVDAQYAQIPTKCVAAIRKISPEPIRFSGQHARASATIRPAMRTSSRWARCCLRGKNCARKCCGLRRALGTRLLQEIPRGFPW